MRRTRSVTDGHDARGNHSRGSGMIYDVVADFPRAAGRAAQTRGGGAPTKPAWWISNRETEEKQLARLSGCRLYVHAVRAEGYYSLRSGGEAALQVEQQRVRRGVCQSRGEQMRASRRYLRVCERSPIDSVCSRCRARPFSQTQRGRAVCSCGRRLHPITPVSSCRVPLVEGCAPVLMDAHGCSEVYRGAAHASFR